MRLLTTPYSSLDATAAVEIPIFFKCLLAGRLGSLQGHDAEAHAKALGAPQRVQGFTKASVGAISMQDADGALLADWQVSQAAWFSSLRSTSIFFALLAAGARSLPLRSKLGIRISDATGWIVGEGAPIPLSRFEVEPGALEPQKAAALIVFTEDVVRDPSAGAQSQVAAALREGVSKTVDTAFWEAIADSSTFSAPSTGNDEDAMRADVQAVLNAVNVAGSSGGPFVWGMAVDVANAATVMEPLGKMTPTGGTFFNLPAIVSPGLPDGTLRLFDGSGLVLAAGDVDFPISGNASIEMSNTPTSSSATPAASSAVSMFQTNSIAAKAEVAFAATRIRPEAAGEVTGIQWAMP